MLSIRELLSNLLDKFVTGTVIGDVNAKQSTHDNLNCNSNLQVNNTDVSISNSVPVFSKYTTHIFHDTETSTSNGTQLNINSEKSLTIFTSGTSTSRTLEFKGKDIDDNIYDIVGVKINDTNFITSINTTNINEVWYFENIEGYTAIYINISAIAGGNVTVKGKVVA